MANSKNLAAKVLRAQRVADFVKQISEIEFCLDEKRLDSLFIGNKKVMINSPVIQIEYKNIPQDISERIGMDSICNVLNTHLENAKTEILQLVQELIFAQDDIEEEVEEDGFEEL